MGSKSKKSVATTNVNETLNLVTGDDSQANNIVGDGNTLVVERADINLASDIIQAGAEQNIQISDNLTEINNHFLDTVQQQNQDFLLATLEINQSAQQTADNAIAAANASTRHARESFREATDTVAYLASEQGNRFSALTADALGLLHTGTTAAFEAVNEVSADAIDTVIDANNSEAKKLTETTVMMVLGAAAITAIAPVLFRAK